MAATKVSNHHKAWRIWLIGGYAVIVVVIAVLWAFSLFSPIDDAEVQQEYANLTALANAGSAVVENTDLSAADAVEKIASDDALRVTLIGHDGTVIADSKNDSTTMENHASRPEVGSALAGQTGQDRRYSQTDGTDYLYVAVPTTYDGQSAVLRVSTPISQVNTMAQQFRTTGLVLLVAAVLIAIIAARFASTRAAQPVNKLERVRTDFVANASHELKTPVAGILLLAESIESASEDGDMKAVETFSHRLYHESKRLQSLVTDLLDLSRLEDADVKGHSKSMCDFHSAVITSFEAHVQQAAKKGIAFSLHDEGVEGQSLWVPLSSADAMLIVDNLLENAIRYTQEGSVDITLRHEGGKVILDVADTGIGIAPADQERIFERFFRADKARSRELGGTGLGLALVRHAVERGNGSVMVESELGSGSTFTVELDSVRK